MDPSGPVHTPDLGPLEKRLLRIACVCLLPALIVVGLWLEPDPRGHGTHQQLGAPACGVLAWTGVPCPGCGVTTSVSLAVRGRLVAAAIVQPFGLVVLGVAVVLFARSLGVRPFRSASAGLGFVRWARPLALALLLSWAYKLARMGGWL